VGSVVPDTVSGADSANKYLAKTFAALRAVSNEDDLPSIKTLEQLLQLWRKDQEEDALILLTSHKIPWGSVLVRGAPTERKTVKKQLITQIVSPPKPSKSPWVSGAERTYLSGYFKEVWEHPEELRKQWVELTPQQQHANFTVFVKHIREHYELMKKISSGVNAKLGHRKKWIEEVCREAGVQPKSKKDKGNMFLWTTAFFKRDLTKLGHHQSLVRTFAPNHYLEGNEWIEDFGVILRAEGKIENPASIPEGIPEERKGLWSEWVVRFQPNLSYKEPVVDEDDFIPSGPEVFKGAPGIWGADDDEEEE
jgi:hypothetical protein